MQADLTANLVGGVSLQGAAGNYLALGSGDFLSIYALNSLFATAGMVSFQTQNSPSQVQVPLTAPHLIVSSAAALSLGAATVLDVSNTPRVSLAALDSVTLAGANSVALAGPVLAGTSPVLLVAGAGSLLLQAPHLELASPVFYGQLLSSALSPAALTQGSTSIKYCTLVSISSSLLLVQKTLVAPCTDAATGARLFLPTPTVLGVAAGAMLMLVNAAPATDVAQVFLKLETWLDANGPSMAMLTLRPGASVSLIAVPYTSAALRWSITASSPASASNPLVTLAYFGNPSVLKASCFDIANCP